MIKNFKYLAMAAAVAALCSAAACAKINGGDDNTDDGSSNVPGVELVNEADKEISTVAVGLTKEVMLAFSEGLTKENVALKVPAEASEWCTASFSNEKDAILLSTTFNMEEDRSATISVVDIEDETKVYLSFIVKSIAGYFNVTSKPAYEIETVPTMKVSAEQTTIEFTIETNLGNWYAYSYGMMDLGPAPWIGFSQASGRGGETCTVTVNANEGSDRRAYINFDLEEPGEFAMQSDYFTLFLTQGPGQSSVNPEDFKVFYWGPSGEQIYLEGNSYEVQFAANDEGYMASKDFDIEPEGASFYPVFCNPGTTQKDMSIEGAENPWMMITNWGLGIVPTKNTTGASRSTDLVLFTDSNCTTELFRFKITQDGTVAEM